MEKPRRNSSSLGTLGTFSIVILLVMPYVRDGIAQSERKRLPEASTEGLTIDILLNQLEKNITEYRQSVPNLYCTEKAKASRTMGGGSVGEDSPGGFAERARPEQAQSTSQALFRLQRTVDTTDKGTFQESRAVQKLNGTRSESDSSAIPQPATLFGIYSNGLNIFSREGRACFSFKLHPPQQAKPIRVDFADLPPAERGASCPPFRATSGHVLIDRETMHVVHIDKHVPRQELVPGIVGSWDWTEDYAPVLLLNRRFWMPTKIHSRSLSTSVPAEWTFDAVYSDYHLFHTEAHLVP